MKNKQIIIWVIVLVIVGGLSFYAGTKVSGNKVGGPNGAGQFAGGPGGARMGRGGGVGFTTGEVISKDATSVTVKLKDGGSKIIFVASSTAVQKTSPGSIDDIVVGSQVSANGSANADGSINAVTISSRPMGAPGQGGAQGGPAGQPAK